ncbi:unnamed protein product [Coregonus sp. 'balchen']|nr:unnamed protein product [Coregonus sp. 'balchen']
MKYSQRTWKIIKPLKDSTEYKIFATILANRLQMYLLNQRTKTPLSPHCTVTLVINGETLINWKFLSIAIKSMKAIPIQKNPKEDNILKKVLSQDLGILRKLLLRVEHLGVHKKHLHHDCPFTPALFSLCLKYMEDDISRVIPNIYIGTLGVQSVEDHLYHIRVESGIEMKEEWQN